jgi:hypothetical protein
LSFLFLFDKHHSSKAMSPLQDCSGVWLVLAYTPITLPATEKQMNRITVRAIIFKPMKRAVLSFISLSPFFNNMDEFH